MTEQPPIHRTEGAQQTEPPARAGQGRTKRHPAFRAAQLVAVVAVASLLALLVWRVSDAKRGFNLVKAVQAGKQPSAPAFVLPVIWRNSDTWPASRRTLVREQMLALTSLRGRPVVLNFWASWCIPCKKEAPRLNAAARAHTSEVLFLGIDVEDLKSDARSFLSYHRVPYPSVNDKSGLTYDGYGLTGVPETYWLDARGRIVSHFAGPVSRDQLEGGISESKKSR